MAGTLCGAGAEGRTRTGTGSRPPPPQDGVSTKFHHFGTRLVYPISVTFVKCKTEREASLQVQSGLEGRAS
jgi:hypothetical protein